MAKRKRRAKARAAPALPRPAPKAVRTWPLGLRVFAYWLFYAVVGLVVLLMILAGGGDFAGGENNKVRDGTKVIGVLSGLFLGIALIALFFTDHTMLLPKLMLYVGSPIAGALSVWTWARLDTDLSR